MPGVYVRDVLAADVIPKMIELAKGTFPEGMSFNVQTTVGATANFPNTPPGGLSEHLRPFLQMVSADENKKLIAVQSVSITSTSNGQHTLTFTLLPDGAAGNIQWNFPDDTVRILRLLSALQEQFSLTTYIDVPAAASAAQRTALQMRERSVAALQVEVERLGIFLSTLATREVETRQKIQADLELAYQERRDAMDAEHRERVAALETRERTGREDLAELTRKHALEVAKFELGEAKYVRRKLLEKIEEVLSKTKDFTISKSTIGKRNIIHWVVVLMLAATATIAAYLVKAIISLESYDWRLFVPLAAATATFVTTCLYYLRWNDRWFREHADVEFAANRYHADIYRASWVAELVSEGRAEKEDVPDELIAAFTRNLFRELGPATRDVEHPLENLTSLMKRATSFSVGKGFLSVAAPGQKMLKAAAEKAGEKAAAGATEDE